MSIQLASVTTIEGYHRVEKLQELVWGMEPLECVPLNQLLTTHGAGGIVIGAYDGSPKNSENMVGFVYGFPGLRDGELVHVSHMAGVLKPYRDQGIGFLLKYAQWKEVRRQSRKVHILRAVWTYDPLESRNAHFNFAVLGVVCNRYDRNHYGEIQSSAHAGLATDRMEVDWWVSSRRVKSRLETKPAERQNLKVPYQAPAAIRTGIIPSTKFLEPVDVVTNLAKATVTVEIPPNIQEIKKQDLDLARKWRLVTREVFESLFAQNYNVTDFVSHVGDANVRRSFYILTRKPKIA